MGAKVSVVLINNGSALNVCPFKTTLTIGLDMETIIPSPLTVRAYDNTSRKVIGTFKAPCKIGPIETIVEFHVMDITPNYDLFPYCSHEVVATMKNMGYILGMDLGKEGKGVVEFSNVKTQMTKEGLEFFEGYNGMKKNFGTLNGNFMKEGESFPYCGLPEPWVGKDEKVYPSWEMFFKEKLTFNDKPTVVIKEIKEEVNWVNYMDAEAMKTMIKMSGDVFAITNEEPSDPSKFITPDMEPINNWT